MKSIFIDKKLDVLVVSGGGVGTTLLMRQLSKYRTVNNVNDGDGFKHLPVPPITINRSLKVIFVFGDPILAVKSLFRRSFQGPQSYKLQAFKANRELVKDDESIHDYANEGVDKLFLKDQFENWYYHYPIYDTLFISFEHLFDQLEAVRSFLDLPSEFIADFPKKRVRNSEKSELPQYTMSQLQKLYGEFASQLERIAPYTERSGKYFGMKLFIKIVLSSVYQRAILRSTWRLLKAQVKKNMYVSGA